MTGPLVVAEGERTCGYSDCRHSLDYNGVGRPPEYCADRRWPPGDPAGKTCKQMAAQERSAQRAVGLETLLAGYRATTATFVPVAETLADRLTTLLRAADSLGQGALSRIADAEQAMLNAVDRAELAEADAVRARRAETAAVAARDCAITDRTEAEVAAREVRIAADEQVRGALADVAEAQRSRGVAEANAAAAARAAIEAEGARTTAMADARSATDTLDDMRAQLTAAMITAGECSKRADVAEATVSHVREMLDTAAQIRAADQQRVADLTEQLQHLRATIEELEHAADAARCEISDARAVSQNAETKAAAATERAARAESAVHEYRDRYEQLVARLVDSAANVSMDDVRT
jgi:chromosome segregation ATPase